MSRRRWLPALLWLAVILTATSVPLSGAPVVPGGDKAVHAIMYGVLAVLVVHALAEGRHRLTAIAAALPLVALLAAVDEWHQLFIPGRSASVGDWLADVAGAGLALLVSGAVHGRRESAS